MTNRMVWLCVLYPALPLLHVVLVSFSQVSFGVLYSASGNSVKRRTSNQAATGIGCHSVQASSSSMEARTGQRLARGMDVGCMLIVVCCSM